MVTNPSKKGDVVACPAVSVLYHVCETWDGGDLESLAARIGEGPAYEEFARRWPEGGDLGIYHVHYVHLHWTREDAEDHAAYYGGEVLRIDVAGLHVDRDTLEFHHPMVRDHIPAYAVSRCEGCTAEAEMQS